MTQCGEETIPDNKGIPKRQLMVTRTFASGDVAMNGFAADLVTVLINRSKILAVHLYNHRDDDIITMREIPIPKDGSLELYVE